MIIRILRTVHRHLCRNMQLALTLSLFALNAVFMVSAQTVPVALNMPEVKSSSVEVGDQGSHFAFDVANANVLQFQIIAPINGVNISIVGPDGIEVLTSQDPNVATIEGSLQTPPLPGNLFQMPVISGPKDGVWSVNLTYPAAVEKTVVVATLLIDSDYQVGMVIDKNVYRMGQTAAFGVIVLDKGLPIAGLTPELTITAPSGAKQALVGEDTGNITVNFDGLANDGIYSAGVVFDEIGVYTLSAVVAMAGANEPILKNATTQVNVTEPLLAITNISSSIEYGAGACISALNAHATIDTYLASNYVVDANLVVGSGKLLASINREVLSPSLQNYSLRFSSEDILANTTSSGPFSLGQVKVVSFNDEGILLEDLAVANIEFANVSRANLCSPAITVVNQLNVLSNLTDGKISSLSFSFPIDVSSNGSYNVTGKVTDGKGQDIEVFAVNPRFSTGRNYVELLLGYEQLQSVDGPFSVESILVVGAGSSAQSSVVGSSEAYSRWQFMDYIVGDLDGDGDVDSSDRSLLLQFRGNAALSPGDRRDLTNDSVIDLRDVRYIQTMVCASGNCPTQ
ncbi:choice-of-anchor X domain-containing protein [Paraglaciecola sp.]|uniref:choice-of-anchor X domain-containing protein n=1 Tax=Paraglaciecola sp. TaxID=1920173 RepID=UPI0030F4698B